MRHPPKPRTYITAEAATLIGITFVAATSYILTSIMARRKRSSAPKTPQSANPVPTDPKALTDVNASGLAQGKPAAAVAAPVMQEADTRPGTS